MAVYAWGLGKNGQLGNGSKENQTLPVVVKFETFKAARSDQIVSISAGGLFTCLCTISGKVFSFGCGKHGRLGTQDECDHCEATAIVALNSQKIVQVYYLFCSSSYGHFSMDVICIPRETKWFKYYLLDQCLYLHVTKIQIFHLQHH